MARTSTSTRPKRTGVAYVGSAAPLRELPEWLEQAATLLLALLGGIVALRIRSAVGLSLLALLLGSIPLVAGLLAFIQGIWIPVVPGALAGVASLGVSVAYISQQERAEKAMVMHLFGRFVSRKLVTEIWRNKDVFMDGNRPVPQRATITVLLADLMGYTEACEELGPAVVMEWIGLFLSAMAREVEDHGGIVNDFLGDGLMATFGAPVVRSTEGQVDEDAFNAVECGLAMGAELERLDALAARPA